MAISKPVSAAGIPFLFIGIMVGIHDPAGHVVPPIPGNWLRGESSSRVRPTIVEEATAVERVQGQESLVRLWRGIGIRGCSAPTSQNEGRQIGEDGELPPVPEEPCPGCGADAWGYDEQCRPSARSAAGCTRKGIEPGKRYRLVTSDDFITRFRRHFSRTKATFPRGLRREQALDKIQVN